MIYQFDRGEIETCGSCPCWCPDVISKGYAIDDGCCYLNYEERHRHTAKPIDCPLVAISKTETTSARALSCWYCTEIEKHGVVAVKTVLDKAGRKLDAYETPYNYCPNCGRKLKENEHDLS